MGRICRDLFWAPAVAAQALQQDRKGRTIDKERPDAATEALESDTAPAIELDERDLPGDRHPHDRA